MDALWANFAFWRRALAALLEDVPEGSRDGRALLIPLGRLELLLVSGRPNGRVNRPPGLLPRRLLLGLEWRFRRGRARGGVGAGLRRLRRKRAWPRLRHLGLRRQLLVRGVWVELRSHRLSGGRRGSLSPRELIHEVFDGLALRIHGPRRRLLSAARGVRGRLWGYRLALGLLSRRGT